MAFSVKFNGHELSDYLIVTEGFDRGIGSPREIELEKIGKAMGKKFLSATVNEKEISMPFLVRYNLIEKRRELAKILNVDEPKELIFGDEPNLVYYAMPTGDVDLAEKVFTGRGVINWVIPDGYAHATALKPFKAALNDEGILEMTIVNNGSVAVPIDYEIEMNHENGYVGIVSEHGVIELGDIAEVDATPAVMSQDITVNKKGAFSNWTNGSVFSENTSKKPVTTMSADTSFGGRLGVLPASFSNTTNSNYFGAIKEYIWNDTASDWYLWARAWFETGKIEQTGMWTLALADENNIPIAAMSVHTASKTSNTGYVTFQVGTGEISKMNNVKQIQFTPSYWVRDNPYGSEGRNQNRNMFDLRKEGNKITFFWYGQYFPFTVPSKVASLKLKKIQFFAGQFKGRASNKRVTHMYINDLTLRKINVPYMRDEPNRYPEGSLITIDGDAKRPYFNNMPRLEDEVIGSHYFKAPPGETKVQFYYSDFSQPIPTVTATIREGYL